MPIFVIYLRTIDLEHEISSKDDFYLFNFRLFNGGLTARTLVNVIQEKIKSSYPAKISPPLGRGN